MISSPPPPLMGVTWNPATQSQQPQPTPQHNTWANVNWSQYYNYYNQMQMQQSKNAPPGFGNAVVLNGDGNQNNDIFPPLPSGPGPIKFNLQSNRYNPRLSNFNPLENSPQKPIPQHNEGNQQGFLSKNQKKKNKKKQKQQQMMQAPPAPIIGPAPFVAVSQKLELTPPAPPVISSLDFSRPPPPLPPGTPPKTDNNVPDMSISPGLQNPTDAWPASLNHFVNRCYAKCKTKFDKDQIDIILKGKITSAANKGILHTTDWDKEIAPSVHSERISNPFSIVDQPIVGTVTPTAVPILKSQNNLQNQNKNQGIKGISEGLGARLGIKNRLNSTRSGSKSPRYSTGNSKRRSRSSSSDRSMSPRRKSRRGSDSPDLTSSIHSYTSNSSKKVNKKTKKQKPKKEPFYSEYGSIGGEVDGDKERLQKRAARFKQQSTTKKQSAPLMVRNKRLSLPTRSNLFVDDSGIGDDDESDLNALIDLHIVGTCKDLEKSFLRLTKAPSPTEVRPVDVLKFSLQNVKKRWMEKQDYFYACDQLKSIRQDLTVSIVKVFFSVKIYSFRI